MIDNCSPLAVVQGLLSTFENTLLNETSYNS